MNTLTNERLEEIKEMAVDAAKNYGSEWLSSLVGGSDGKYNAITSDLTNEVVVRAEDSTRESGWLCDYLEAVSPVAVVTIIDQILSLEAQLAEAKSSWQIYEDAAKSAEAQLAELRGQEPDLYLCPVTRSGEKLFSPCGQDYPRGRGYYIHAVPPAASQPYTVPDEWAYADAVNFIRINGMSNETREGVAMRAHNACRADMLQSGNSPVVPDGSVPEALRIIGNNINTQDNRITDQPMFVVFQKREIIGSDEHSPSRIVWVWDGEEVSELRAKRLEALHQGCRDTRGYDRYAMQEIDEFVTACFTEQGCKDYLSLNGHNLRQPYIFACGSYRNNEYQTVRNWLSAAAPQHKGE